MPVVAIGLVVYFQASTPIFLTTDNLRNIAQATAPTAIVAVGIVFLSEGIQKFLVQQEAVGTPTLSRH